MHGQASLLLLLILCLVELAVTQESANRTQISLALESAEQIPPRRHPLADLEPVLARSIFTEGGKNPLQRTTIAPPSRRGRSRRVVRSPEAATDSDFEDIDRAPGSGEHHLPTGAIRGHDRQKQLMEKHNKGQIEVEPALLEYLLVDGTVQKNNRILRNHIDPSVLFAVSRCVMLEKLELMTI